MKEMLGIGIGDTNCMHTSEQYNSCNTALHCNGALFQ